MESGMIHPPTCGVYTLDDVAAALRELDERRAVGRLLIRLPAAGLSRSSPDARSPLEDR